MWSLSRRRATIVIFAILITVLLIAFHGTTGSVLRAPSLILDFGTEKAAKPVFVESDNDRFRWSQVKIHHPVENVIPLPSGARDAIPRIQHQPPKSSESQEDRKIRMGRLETVKQEFLHAWNGYKKHAWLSDEVAPLSGEPRSDFGGWAATLVDNLDTLWVMDLQDEFEDAVQSINEIDFSSCSLDELNVFETTIRYLGGFLAAYDLSGNEILLQKAWELGNMLYVAFDTPNRMPVMRWDFKAAAENRRQTALDNTLVAEIGSLTLEFTRLAQVTQDDKFYDAIQRVMNVFEEQQEQTKLPGVWPVIVNAKSMIFTDHNGFTLGGMADSLYEYLPKQHMLVGGAVNQSRKLFERAATTIKKHMLYRPMTPNNDDILLVGDVSSSGDMEAPVLEPKNQHLTCFAGGMFGIAGKIFDNPEDVEIGRGLTDGCLWAYESSQHGVMPEILSTIPCGADSECQWNETLWQAEAVRYSGIERPEWKKLVQSYHLPEGVTRIQDTRYILRPEAIESIFVLYRITGDESYRERAWGMFEAIIKLTKTKIAHAGVDDCVASKPSKMDRMESFWTAETLKYFYLLYSDPGLISLDEYVLNTEAHPLRRPS